MSSSQSSITPLSPGTEPADGVFDVPPSVLNLKEEISERVSAVADSWRWGMVSEDSLAIVIPTDQNPRDISKERFVQLLEYCEEELGVQRVLAVFEKPGLSLAEGFPRTLRFIGFRVVNPEAIQEPLSAEKHFVLSYVV